MNSLMNKALAPSTKKVYRAGLERFRHSCDNHHLPFLPTSEEIIRLFCTAESTRVAHGTIATYVAAIRMAHLQHGFPDPTAEAPLLSLLLKGIKRTRQSNAQQRQPVTASLLECIKPALRSLPLSSSQRTLYWAAFTLAFYA